MCLFSFSISYIIDIPVLNANSVDPEETRSAESDLGNTPSASVPLTGR